MAYSGPLYSNIKIDGNKVIISFTNTDGGLKLTDKNSDAFELAGVDGTFYPAKATIEGEQIVLTSSKVAEPVSARYAFKNGSLAVLFNGEGLPASSFTTVLNTNQMNPPISLAFFIAVHPKPLS